MTSVALLLRSLRYFWRSNLAVGLGVVVATAVIGGALLVGDSVRDSLRTLSLERLAGVDHALVGQRFVREQLADAMLEATRPLGVEQVAPAIVMPAGLKHAQAAVEGEEQRLSRAGGVTVYGVDGRFWELLQRDASLTVPEGNQVVLNQRTAEQLHASVGDEVSLVIEIPPSIPRDALLGDRDETTTELVLQVSGIAADATSLGRFGVNPSQQSPLNAYVSLATLQRQLGLAEVLPTRRNPNAKPARVNALFFGRPRDPSQPLAAGLTGDALTPATAERITELLDEQLTLADLGLKVAPHADHGYFSLESEQMLLEEAVASAGEEVTAGRGWPISPVLVYLLNRMGRPEPADSKTGYSMYSVVAGVEFTDRAPFGPFEFLAGGVPQAKSTNAAGPVPVVVNEWLADDLQGAGGDGTLVDIGTVFPVEYHVVGDRGQLPTLTRELQVAGIVKLAGPAADRGFTPEVEGVTDVGSYSDWREPFPLDHQAITKRDEDYWDARRATPKIFLPLPTAQALWKSRYGELTSLRIAPAAGIELEDAAAQWSTDFLARITPRDTGLVVLPVKLQGLMAAAGTTDFSGLFIGFSFFLIAAAMLLIGLLFRLGIERRVRELGLLSAVGWTPARVRMLMLAEGTGLAAAGALLGVPAAIGYAGLMIYGLRTWWVRAIGTQYLTLSTPPGSLMIGFVCGVGTALLAIGWSLRRIGKRSSRELLQGQLDPAIGSEAGRTGGRSHWKVWTACALAAGLLAASCTGMVPDTEAFAGMSWRVVTFFLTGLLTLMGAVGGLTVWMDGNHATAVAGRGIAAETRLAMRNASRNRGRSLLTTGLIAAATFVIAAVAAGRRNPQSEMPLKSSGNGGFTLVAESSQPVLYDLNTPEGRKQLGVQTDTPLAKAVLPSLHVAPFRMRAGEDASCLNLYRTRLPTILGVPDEVLDEFDREQRFRFADTPTEHPWRLLNADRPEGRIPVLGDVNTLLYSLKKGVGGVIEVPAEALADARLPQAELEVVGMLDGSVFQGVLLMSETHFQRLFPRLAGFRYFLVEVDPAQAAAASDWLESELQDEGFDADRVSRRLADFLAVQNTYLSTFQTLGGLGLLLGTIGLGAVMLRNVLERRSELALLRAVGLTSGSLLRLIGLENALLLGWGVAAGTLSAALAMLPHLLSTGADVPWRDLALLLASVVIVGLAAPLLAGREAVRANVVQSLRSE